jgi:hypothetical protein
MLVRRNARDGPRPLKCLVLRAQIGGRRRLERCGNGGACRRYAGRHDRARTGGPDRGHLRSSSPAAGPITAGVVTFLMGHDSQIELARSRMIAE